MAALKKQGASGVFGCLAVVFALVGVVMTFICSNENAAYNLSALGTIVCMEIVAAVLIICGLFLNGQKENTDLFGIIPTLASIVVFMLTIGKLISERILLISGLFSYNSQNTAGWQVFYLTVAAIVALLLAVLATIISSFLASKKAPKKAQTAEAAPAEASETVEA